MGSEQESLRGDEIREWLQAWVRRTSQRRVSEALGVNRDPLRRALQGTGGVTGVVREAVERYAAANGIRIMEADSSSPIGKSDDDGNAADDSNGVADDNAPAASEAEHQRNDEAGPEAHSKSGERPAQDNECKPDRPEDGADEASPNTGDRRSRSDSAGKTRDDAQGRKTSSLLGKIEDASTPAELAGIVGAPVLAELPMESALSGARALARGWQWVRDPAPIGLHGDALFYLHTREEVSFADEGAKRVAFAPDTEMFECGLTAAELRYGVHPHQRQEQYVVERHGDRPLLIGIRMAALVPKRPYPDEKWFFGSEGSIIDGERLPSAAELIASRRRLLVLSDSFPEDGSGKHLTPWQIALMNERMHVELQMVNCHYALTIGEHVDGARTWAPSTRLGIETRWRHAEIETNEAAIRMELRARRRRAMLLWLPRLMLSRIRTPSKPDLDGAVCGDRDWRVIAPP